MSTKPAPTVPARPSRSSKKDSDESSDVPKIPPRPTRRPNHSPQRDRYAPSPLNEQPPSTSNLGKTESNDPPSSNPLDRPPSVNLPSVGEEGMEYEGVEQRAAQDDGEEQSSSIQQPAQTRNVNHDLHLHAPRPSLPSSSVREQVRTVTGTTSQQAAAAGIGKVASPELGESDRPSRSVNSRANGSRHESSIASNERRRESLQLGDEHAATEHRQRVPMNPATGDVQAPSPAPQSPSHRTGRGHSRSRSRREASLPPGSYGLHGHGTHSHDKLEKEWYDKHPEEQAREERGQYGLGLGSPRPESMKTRDELNKLVRSSGNRGSGLGTSSEFMGTPDEEVGYLASDELTSHLVSPTFVSKSPLHELKDPLAERSLDKEKSAGVGEEENVEIHVDEPLHHRHHPDGFAPAPDDRVISGTPRQEEREEDGEKSPILAADEADSEEEHHQAAVSPPRRMRSSFGPESDDATRTTSASGHRPGLDKPSSPQLVRSSSNYEGLNESNNQLEDVEEYEPLFPEDDECGPGIEERLKRRQEFGQHKFPSKDIWEDAPNSLQLETTVTTPDIPKHPREKSASEETEKDIDRSKLVKPKRPSEESPSHLADDKQTETSKQRFPSRDIWEDTPESLKLETTVGESPVEEKTTSPAIPRKPSIPMRPQKRPSQPSSGKEQTNATSPAEETRKPPTIPERPKPQVPTRPARPQARGSEENTLVKTGSGSSGDQATEAAAKPKPSVPARPAGSKLSGIKTGFLSDLNNRLKLGPKPPSPEKKEEPEQPAEKGPLSDARKGRARGPARRKPAVQAQAKAPAPSAPQPDAPEMKLVEPWNVWRVADDGVLIVGDDIEPPRKASEDRSGEPAVTEKASSGDEPSHESAPPVSGEGDGHNDTTIDESALDDVKDKEPQATEVAHEAEIEPEPQVEQSTAKQEHAVTPTEEVDVSEPPDEDSKADTTDTKLSTSTDPDDKEGA